MDLRMTISFLQNHYDLHEVEYGYEFVTEKGVVYSVTFLSYPSVSDYLLVNTYMFNIERVTMSDEREGQNDVRVRNTVLYVLHRFFQLNHDAIITICDMSDGKQKARKRLFDSWFNQFNNGSLVKIDAECEIGEMTTFASLLYSSENPSAADLKRNFDELIQVNFWS